MKSLLWIIFLVKLYSTFELYGDDFYLEPPIQPLTVDNPEEYDVLRTGEESNILHPDLKPFSKFVYQLIYPNLFHKAFDFSFTPQEASEVLFNCALLFSETAGLPCDEEGTMPLRTAQAAKKAFEKGITPLAYFQAFLDDIEKYLSKNGIMNPCNVQLLGYKYYQILAEVFKPVSETDTPAARMYNLATVNAKFLSSFGVMPQNNEKYTVEKFIDNLNAV